MKYALDKIFKEHINFKLNAGEEKQMELLLGKIHLGVDIFLMEFSLI